MTDTEKLLLILALMLLATATATGCAEEPKAKKPECFTSKMCRYHGEQSHCTVKRVCGNER